MNPERLLQNFDRLIDTPDAVPRLRRFILDLAVRGKLVEQNPEDEPAAELLKRIEGERRDDKADDDAIVAEEFSVILPDTWSWIKIAQAAHVEMGQSPSSEHYNKSGKGMPFYQGKADFGKRHPAPRYWCSQPTKIAKKGDILISVRAPVGPTNVANEECCIGRGLAALRPNVGINPEYFLLCLNAFEQVLAALGFGTTFVAINKKHLVNFPLPLPPLAEQHRIVAKVDELMKLCDELETTQAKRERRRDRLVAATLHGLNNGKVDNGNGDGFSFEDSARFYFNHLPRLTTRPEHLQQLRQTILNLAVRGKLVPQDPKDEPAAELLKQIDMEKDLLVKQGEIKKQEQIPVAPGEMPYPVPQGWQWCRIQDIFLSVTDGDHLPPPKADDGVPFLVIGNVSGRSLDFTSCRYVSETYYLGLNSIRRPQEGDILYTLVGSYGIPVLLVNKRPFCVQRHIGILRPPKKISAGYLTYSLDSLFVFEQATACATGIAQKTVPLNGLRKMLIPLAPLAEQHRIVTKVDELMALCDEMEARITTNTTTSRKFLEATLQELLSSSSEAGVLGCACNG